MRAYQSARQCKWQELHPRKKLSESLGACPAYLEAMELVNNLCSWLRRYLFHLPGMKKANLQSYLNWFVYLFRVRRDEGKWPKTERVLHHLLTTDSHYRSSW